MIRASRARRREAMSERIVASGLVRLETGGIDSITMQGLADDLGYAVGALYRYFRGKDELLLAMQRYVLDQIRDDLAVVEAAVATLPLPRVERGDRELLATLAAFWAYASLATRRPEQFALLSLSLGDPRPLVDDERARERVMPALVELLSAVGGIFDAAASEGALEPAAGPARALVGWSALHGVLSTKKLSRFDVPGLRPDALVSELLVTLLAGWGAQRRRVAALEPVAREVVFDSFSREKAPS